MCHHAGPLPGDADDGDHGCHGDQPGPGGHAAQEEAHHQAQAEADPSGGGEIKD